MAASLCGTRAELAPLILRLALGGVILPHGLMKVFPGLFGSDKAATGLEATVKAFTETMGLDSWMAYGVIAAESLGALALIFGFLTRLGALGIAAVMVGAVHLVHWPAGFFMNWNQAYTTAADGTIAAKPEGFEFHLLAIGIALALVIKGGGALSVDRALCARREAVIKPL